jgi:hypothetical protein
VGRKKNIHYGTKSTRMSISDRSSSAARPWNDPEVVLASTTYGVPFPSFKGVHLYENRLESTGSLESNERMTCGPCGRFKSSCKCGGE